MPLSMRMIVFLGKVYLYLRVLMKRDVSQTVPDSCLAQNNSLTGKCKNRHFHIDI